jgi:hypothetical protein
MIMNEIEKVKLQKLQIIEKTLYRRALLFKYTQYSTYLIYNILLSCVIILGAVYYDEVLIFPSLMVITISIMAITSILESFYYEDNKENMKEYKKKNVKSVIKLITPYKSVIQSLYGVDFFKKILSDDAMFLYNEKVKISDVEKIINTVFKQVKEWKNELIDIYEPRKIKFIFQRKERRIIKISLTLLLIIVINFIY